MSKGQELVLDTMECAHGYALNDLLKDAPFALTRHPQPWGFDPALIHDVLTNFNAYTLDTIAQELDRSTSIKCLIHIEGGHSDAALQLHVANSFKGLGARHALVKRKHNGDIRMIIYSYYTNNPNLHLSWHVFFNPSVKMVKFPEITEAVNAFRTMFSANEGNKHVKKST